jgi:hypothetical protein
MAQGAPLVSKRKKTMADKLNEDDVAALFADTAVPGSILSKEEIEGAKELARENVDKARRAAELSRIVAEEERRLKRVEGQRTGLADKDEMVDIMIDLAEFSDRISLNSTEYYHGYSYAVPRHVADTLREIMQRTYHHQSAIDGKSLEEMYRRAAPVAISPTGERPLVGAVL